MRRFLCILSALAFLPVGCTSLSSSIFTSWSNHPQSNVWKAFQCSTGHLDEKYGTLFAPCTDSHGSCQSGLLISFDFRGVRLSEQRVAEGLDTVRRDMLKFILENGGKLEGEPRLTLVRGCLEGFEIYYVQSGLKGEISGNLKPGNEPGKWDVECQIFEDSADR
jgi:hypothetical protein